MAVDLDPLLTDLADLTELLRCTGEQGWASKIGQVEARLFDRKSEGSALRDLRSYFSGEGSLNELVLRDAGGYSAHEANEELEELRDRVFRFVTLFGPPEPTSTPHDAENWSGRNPEKA